MHCEVEELDFEPELLKGNVQTVILAVLESGERHGYGLAKEIERRSEEALVLGEGTIYPALRALERLGLIEARWEVGGAGPARKLYTLTDSGKGELEKRRRTWRRFVRSIDLVIGGVPHAGNA